tara:strand:- start:688 stop:906 length:219 start_codon:yes stop_codon:yes gene_type:complete
MKNKRLYMKIANRIYALECSQARLRNDKHRLYLDVSERSKMSKQAKHIIAELNKINLMLKRQRAILRDLKRS